MKEQFLPSLCRASCLSKGIMRVNVFSKQSGAMYMSNYGFLRPLYLLSYFSHQKGEKLFSCKFHLKSLEYFSITFLEPNNIDWFALFSKISPLNLPLMIPIPFSKILYLIFLFFPRKIITTYLSLLFFLSCPVSPTTNHLAPLFLESLMLCHTLSFFS